MMMIQLKVMSPGPRNLLEITFEDLLKMFPEYALLPKFFLAKIFLGSFENGSPGRQIV